MSLAEGGCGEREVGQTGAWWWGEAAETTAYVVVPLSFSRLFSPKSLPAYHAFAYHAFAYFHSFLKLWAALTFWDHSWTGREGGGEVQFFCTSKWVLRFCSKFNLEEFHRIVQEAGAKFQE